MQFYSGTIEDTLKYNLEQWNKIISRTKKASEVAKVLKAMLDEIPELNDYRVYFDDTLVGNVSIYPPFERKVETEEAKKVIAIITRKFGNMERQFSEYNGVMWKTEFDKAKVEIDGEKVKVTIKDFLVATPSCRIVEEDQVVKVKKLVCD